MVQLRHGLSLSGFFICILVLVWSVGNSAAQDLKLYVGNSRGDGISVIEMASLELKLPAKSVPASTFTEYASKPTASGCLQPLSPITH